MKSFSVIALATGTCVVVVSLSACASEQLRRTSYETLKATERQRCLNEAYTDCPRQGNYDAYQEQRERELQPADSEL
jgi:hypothetical protein